MLCSEVLFVGEALVGNDAIDQADGSRAANGDLLGRLYGSLHLSYRYGAQDSRDLKFVSSLTSFDLLTCNMGDS